MFLPFSGTQSTIDWLRSSYDNLGHDTEYILLHEHFLSTAFPPSPEQSTDIRITMVCKRNEDSSISNSRVLEGIVIH